MERETSIPHFEDLEEVCSDCGETFTLEAGEQYFYKVVKGYALPKRCPECRRFRRIALGREDNGNGS